ncbi:MAG: CoA pyrophosphatase [Ilumatobacter sp.]|nr:CoA pyrophosphatase [Ilumatobacter sp.]
MIPHEPALRDRIVANLAAHRLHEVPHGQEKRAAVAIVVVPSEAGSDATDPYPDLPERMDAVPGDVRGYDGSVSGVAGGAAFLLCRRAATLNRHGGQWALPGGRVDPGESAEQTALRELEEELGLTLGHDAVLGRLDDYVTRSGYVMTPVVMWAAGDVELRPDPGEVAYAYRIGLHELSREGSPRFVSIPESERPVVQVPLGRNLIHAPTGAVLVQFRWVALEGRAGERVHHFEQPVFAWK